MQMKNAHSLISWGGGVFEENSAEGRHCGPKTRGRGLTAKEKTVSARQAIQTYRLVVKKDPSQPIQLKRKPEKIVSTAAAKQQVPHRTGASARAKSREGGPCGGVPTRKPSVAVRAEMGHRAYKLKGGEGESALKEESRSFRITGGEASLTRKVTRGMSSETFSKLGGKPGPGRLIRERPLEGENHRF